MNSKDGEKIIDFLHKSEKLKTVLRHSWLSSGRRESVAEHTWRMALMAMMLHPYLDKEVNLLRTIKMILVHDLVEVNYKDNPAFNKQPSDKTLQEKKALAKLTKLLPGSTRNEIRDLWEEYEAGKTPEALFAKAMDKTEVLLQHNEADIKFLTKKEVPFNLHHGTKYTNHDAFLKLFRDLMNQETINIYKKNKVDKKLYKDYL